jgi:hypothetical protein
MIAATAAIVKRDSFVQIRGDQQVAKRVGLELDNRSALFCLIV